MTQLTMAEYHTRFKSSSNMLVPLYHVNMATCARHLYTGNLQWRETWI